MKSDTVSTVSPYICHEVMGLDAICLIYLFLASKYISNLPTSHSPHPLLYPTYYSVLFWSTAIFIHFFMDSIYIY